MPTEKVEFMASIPPIETAIKIHGQEGARLTLDISDRDLPAFFPVTLLRGKIIMVTLQVAKTSKG